MWAGKHHVCRIIRLSTKLPSRSFLFFCHSSGSLRIPFFVQLRFISSQTSTKAFPDCLIDGTTLASLFRRWYPPVAATVRKYFFPLYFVPLRQLARNPAGTNFPLFQTSQYLLDRTYSNYRKYQTRFSLISLVIYPLFLSVDAFRELHSDADRRCMLSRL